MKETYWKPYKWARNITWFLQPGEKFSNEKLNAFTEISGTPGMLSYLGQHLHASVGRQLQITRQVSDDLMLSDFSPGSNFEDVPWPADSVELYYEDPAIPTALVQLQVKDRLEKLFPVKMARPETKIVTIMEEASGILCTQNLRADHWAEALRSGYVPRQGGQGAALTGEENEALVEATKLALKVFAYISASRVPTEVLTRKRMHFGGKPGVKNRPEVPSSKVRYFSPPPSLRNSEPQGGTHRFNGRRGHFRFFSSPVFVNKRNTWTFIAPVPAMDGTIPPPPTYKVTHQHATQIH